MKKNVYCYGNRNKWNNTNITAISSDELNNVNIKVDMRLNMGSWRTFNITAGQNGQNVFPSMNVLAGDTLELEIYIT